ncbi:MAG: PEP-utilizing enzyme, partial [Anaerolineae bacterium]|nr:PEP-utilizing enzyme [Anaerolineae bacterium]
GEAALLESVRNCWVSLFTDRAILYRAQNGFPHRQVKLCVVVQQMVLPEYAGIVFTADPVSGHRQVLSIDASYGLGEALVAGLVSADLYKVDKRSLEIVEIKIADKQIAIRPQLGGGTYQEDLDAGLRTTQVLTEDQIKELAALAIKIEKHYDAPQDIEWAIAGERLYILQSRPITSLYPIPLPLPPDDHLRVYFSFNHAQVMTDPISPMGISIWRLLLPFGKSGPVTEYNPYLRVAGGRIYADISALLYPKPGRRILPRLLGAASEDMAQAVGEIVARPEFLEAARKSRDKATAHGVASWVLPFVLKAQALLWLRSPEVATQQVLARNAAYLESFEAAIKAAPPGLPRLHQLQIETGRLFKDGAIFMIPYVMAGIMSKVFLEGVMGGKVDVEDINAVQRGLEGNVTTEMDLAVGDLADTARRSPQLAAHLSGQDIRAAMQTLETVPGSQDFQAALARYMARYGMRGASEIDIARPRWQDDPTAILQVVVGNLQQPAGSHRRHHHRLVEEGQAAGKRIVAAARTGLFKPLRGWVVKRLVRSLRGYMAVREHPKFMLVRSFEIIKQTLREAAVTLQAQGRISAPEDIWMLELHEVIAGFEDSQLELHHLVAERKAAMAHYQHLTPPRVMTSDGENVVARLVRENMPAGALPGSPVSAGTVEGIARVVLDPAEEVLTPGEILVAPFTDPGWTPLFINAAGLVMEVGGLMTHGSVVAREYGIPAVVGVIDATKSITTGQRIRVHGDEGFVEILD